MLLCHPPSSFLSVLLYMNLCVSGVGASIHPGVRDEDSMLRSLKLIRPLSLSLPPPLRHRGNHLSLWIFRINAHCTCFVFLLTNPFVSQPAASVPTSPPPPNFLPCPLHLHPTPSVSKLLQSLSSLSPLAQSLALPPLPPTSPLFPSAPLSAPSLLCAKSPTAGRDENWE